MNNIPIPVQALVCQYFTANDNRTVLTRISKRFRKAADHPVAWSERVVVNLQARLLPLLRKTYSCRVLEISNADREDANYILKHVKPREHLKLTDTSISSCPESISTLTLRGGCYPLPRSDNVKIVHEEYGLFSAVLRTSMTGLEYLYLTRPDGTNYWWWSAKNVDTGFDDCDLLFPSNLKSVVMRGWNNKDHPTFVCYMSRFRDWLWAKRPQITFDMSGCAYVPRQ